MHEENARSLRRLKETALAPRGANCASEGELRELACGILPPERAEAVLEHVTSCDHCGPLLRRATEELAAEPTPEEESVLERLQSAQPGYSLEMSGRLAAARQRPREAAAEPAIGVPARRGVRVLALSWAFAAAALVVMAVGIGWLYRRSQPAFAEQLLAEAYTEQRTMELRIPGARPAPLRVERGGGDRSRLSRPTALLEAEALIAKELAKHPNDPKWLEERGRAELLDWDYEAAIKSFKRALDVEPDSPALLTGLATAYFQRAEAQDRAIDYGQAIELLGQALAKQPDDPVALFNRAVVSERLFLFQQAREDWNHLLRVDAQGGWAAEAKRHLEGLKDKTDAHERRYSEPLFALDALAQPAAWGEEVDRAVEGRIEDYLNAAVEDWLPSAFSRWESAGSQRIPQVYAHAALLRIAAVANRNHGDSWLNDLLRPGSARDMSRPVRALSLSIKAVASGDYEESARQASAAAVWFRASGNRAGELRARFQETYANQLSSRGAECAREASALLQVPELAHYPWLKAQFLMERAICLNFLGDLGAARWLAWNAGQVASRSGYGDLELRAMAVQSTLEADIGNRASAWKTAVAGLSRYWDGKFPNLRGYALYTSLDELANDSHQWFLQVSIWKQALGMLATSKNTLLQAIAHFRLGVSAVHAGLGPVAEESLKQAERLLRDSPRDEATRNNELEAEVWLARLEMMNKDYNGAFQRLNKALPDAKGTSNRYVALDFFEALGELESKRGELHEAENNLSTAVGFAERGLASLRTEADRLRWNREANRAYRALIELKIKSGEPNEALRLWEWYRAAAIRRRGKDLAENTGRHQTSGGDRELENSTLLTYAVLPDGLAIWITDSSGITGRWFPIQEQNLVALANEFAGLCADPASDPAALRARAASLYQVLVAPVAGHLHAPGTLVVESDGELASIPMQALVGPDGNYLGKEYAVVSSPGLYAYKALRRSSGFSSASRVLLVANPAITTGQENLVSLSDTRDEVTAITNLLPNHRVLTGKQATWSQVEAGLPWAAVFHFAGHGVATESNVGLYLAEDPVRSDANSFLNVLNLRPERLAGIQLAVFSGCSTGKGAENNPYDAESLMHAFLRAGVPHVVASRWNVDSAVSGSLMGKFYRGLLAGGSVARSLQTASEKIRSEPGHDHPYYWAAFSTFGRT